MDGLWALSEGVGLIVRAIKISKLCDHNTPMLQTDGRYAIARPRFALTIVHRAVAKNFYCW